jgi:SAM-dependent methyltransferase
MKDWFKHWFNSHYYFLLYKNRNEEEAKLFFDLIQKNLTLHSDWKILDFCCGYGRLSKVIAKNGFNVTGVDLSEKFIQLAKDESIKENLNINFIQCDARYFDENQKFNLGISFFTSFGYFSDEENELTFKNFAKSIVRNGWIVFDYFNPDFVLRNLINKESFKVENYCIEITRKVEINRINKTIKIRSDENSEEFIESVRIYNIDELKKLFERNEMTIQKIYGDYSGNELGDFSPRIIIFAQKR